MLCNFNDKIPYQNEQLPINLIITFVLIFKTQIIPQSRKVLVHSSIQKQTNRSNIVDDFSQQLE